MRASTLYAVTLLLSFGASSCAVTSLEAPSREVFVGRIEGTDAVVAVVSQGAQLDAYVCGGASSFREVTRWFHHEGALEDSVSLSRGGEVVALQRTGNGIAGRITSADGRAMPFVAQGNVGELYHTIDDGCRTGVIAWREDSGAMQVQGAWCNREGAFEQVTPLRPIEALDREALRVQVRLADGMRELRVTPVLP